MTKSRASAKPGRYVGIPIKAAEEIAKRYQKTQVIIVAWDAEHGREHVTTYGINKEQCRQAALGGTKVKQALGWPEAVLPKKRLPSCPCGHPKVQHDADGCSVKVGHPSCDDAYCGCSRTDDDLES